MEKVAKTTEIPSFGKKLIEISGKEVLLINIKGTFYAVENECPHQGAPLTSSVIKDGHLSCPRHGWRFNLSDGKCADHPEYTLATYQVKIEGDDIYVAID